MQPTQMQVERSLAALREGERVDEVVDEPALISAAGDLPAELFEELERTPPVRADRLAEARQRLAAGDQPDATALASRMVGRLVCDRLR